MTAERANKIYDILVKKGGAYERMRGAFIYYTIEDMSWDEWRFSGKLGFGGKYRSGKNEVDCYSEDENPERLQIIEEINKLLKAV